MVTPSAVSQAPPARKAMTAAIPACRGLDEIRAHLAERLACSCFACCHMRELADIGNRYDPCCRACQITPRNLTSSRAASMPVLRQGLPGWRFRALMTWLD